MLHIYDKRIYRQSQIVYRSEKVYTEMISLETRAILTRNTTLPRSIHSTGKVDNSIRHATIDQSNNVSDSPYIGFYFSLLGYVSQRLRLSMRVFQRD